MAHHFTTSYLEDSLELFRYYKKLAEGAMAQAGDAQLFVAPGPEADRCRDTEFEDPSATRAALMELWEVGWSCVFGALEPLHDRRVTGVFGCHFLSSPIG